MKTCDLIELKNRLDSLTVFRSLLDDPVLSSLQKYLKSPDVYSYCNFVSLLYSAGFVSLSEYVGYICENNENIYVRSVGGGKDIPVQISKAVEAELEILQEISDLTSDDLRSALEWKGFLPEISSVKSNLKEAYRHRVENIALYGYGIYADNRMFYLDANAEVVPVKNSDKIRLSDLVDYQSERKKILDNTKALLEGKPAANILLTGDAGTGKSSTVKAIVNELFAEGLRIIEVRKDQLCVIPQILDRLADNPLKFILFIDDLSFLKDDDNFNALKAVLEGSVSAKSDNVVIYATGNRRHLIKETFSDREGDDIHRNETLQELISLSERFGMHITFQKPDKKTYIHIVRHLADKYGLSDPELELKAERFALERGSRSARVAKQFVDGLRSSF